MPTLIKENSLTDNIWRTVAKTDDAVTKIADDECVLIPLAMWLEHQAAFINKSNIGIWLDADEPPEAIADQCNSIAVIAINFPVFSDGRGYSYAQNLRGQYGYKGDLRAIGDIQKDQLYFYKRCGFSSFAIREDRDANTAKAGLEDFSAHYQGAADDSTPLFKRR